MVATSWKDKIAGILYPPGVTRLDPKVSTALFLILFSTQLTLTTPFSYLPAMVSSFGYKDHERGYYAGIIASSLFVGRFIGGYFWGWLTDRIGRRPVLLFSAAMTYLATIMFGFTFSLPWAIGSRFLQGLFNGVIVVGRASFAEICDDTNQGIGVALVFAAWNSAIVLGPAVGGYLADPVVKYPGTFGKGFSKTLFTKYRFLLPSLVVSCLMLVSILAIFFTFEETLGTRNGNSHDSEEEELISKEKEALSVSDSIDEDDDVIEEAKEIKTCCCCRCLCCRNCFGYFVKTTFYSLITDRTILLTTIMFGLSGFIIIGFQELGSLWMATGYKLGGLSFKTNHIGTALLVPALVSVVFQPIIFGRMERGLGGILTLKIALVVLALMTALFPLIHDAYKVPGLMWTMLIVFRMIRMTADICTRSAIALFINNSVFMSKAGAVNGFAFSSQEIMRTFSPTLVGSLFAWSIKPSRKNVIFPFDYHLAFFFLTVLIAGLFAMSFALPERLNRPRHLMKTGNSAVAAGE